ncbi:Twin-arginine translocation protein TatB [hydrothermal vent metagenome]|uniref:Twin-arginine translocation protein TatB n=1 Tax=hydrothermal vent metagenome TaxID=652676 RepID=A0A3B0Y3T9_9ZZZZ
MFDVGFLELTVILVLALLVLGPERLPKAAKTIGYWFGKTRRYVQGMKEQVEAEFDATEVKRLLHNQDVQIRELRDKLGNAEDYVKSEIESPFDDDDPGNDHQNAVDDSAAEPQYEIIEEDDGGSNSHEQTPQSYLESNQSPLTKKTQQTEDGPALDKAQ